MVLPDYIIIGAMKCGTSTLAAQLAAQDGMFMTSPKEPNFFSDDDVYGQGPDWYAALFDAALPGDMKGEASTHYTKLPDYPETVARLVATGARPKLIYLIRNPLDRIVSHYIHEWTQGVINTDITDALGAHPGLISYSRYADQLAPWIAAFGAENILVLSLEQMQIAPQTVLDRVGGFLGRDGLIWHDDLQRLNVSSERTRRLPLQHVLLDYPVMAWVRRRLIPQAVRDRVKATLQMRERPFLPAADHARLAQIFRNDYLQLQAAFPDRPDLAQSYPFIAT